jgi:hypothetical protein
VGDENDDEVNSVKLNYDREIEFMNSISFLGFISKFVKVIV